MMQLKYQYVSLNKLFLKLLKQNNIATINTMLNFKSAEIKKVLSKK